MSGDLSILVSLTCVVYKFSLNNLTTYFSTWNCTRTVHRFFLEGKPQIILKPGSICIGIKASPNLSSFINPEKTYTERIPDWDRSLTQLCRLDNFRLRSKPVATRLSTKAVKNRHTKSYLITKFRN